MLHSLLALAAGAFTWLTAQPSAVRVTVMYVMSLSSMMGGIRSGSLASTNSTTVMAVAEVQIAPTRSPWMSNNEIAGELVISRCTVESHLARIFRKLGIRTRTQLATISLDREP